MLASCWLLAANEDIKRYIAELQSAFMSTVDVIMTLSEMRDPYTAGHERRVGAIAAAKSCHCRVGSAPFRCC